jgi:hypothetical protein
MRWLFFPIAAVAALSFSKIADGAICEFPSVILAHILTKTSVSRCVERIVGEASCDDYYLERASGGDQFQIGQRIRRSERKGRRQPLRVRESNNITILRFVGSTRAFEPLPEGFPAVRNLGIDFGGRQRLRQLNRIPSSASLYVQCRIAPNIFVKPYYDRAADAIESPVFLESDMDEAQPCSVGRCFCVLRERQGSLRVSGLLSRSVFGKSVGVIGPPKGIDRIGMGKPSRLIGMPSGNSHLGQLKIEDRAR